MLDKLLISYKSDKNIDTIREELEKIAGDFQFSVLGNFPFKEMMLERGFPIEREIFVYSICQGKFASKVLTKSPHFSVSMPCSVSIYVEDDKTVIATQNMTDMITTIEDESLRAEATELFTRLTTMMGKLK